MKKTKGQKGITLIALIITIVVLMILAAVAINSITNDGILGKAESVKNTYTEKVTEEQKMLDYYQLVLEQKAWTQNGTTVSRNGQTLNIGEAVKIKVGEELKTYKELGYDGENATYTGEWVVLGVEYGKLLLVSASSVGNLELEGKEGYNTCIAQLTDICDDYINTTYADEARSIKVEDINRVTGFKPESESNYGTTYTYTSDFEHVDGRIASESNPITVTNTIYYYEIRQSALGETAYNALCPDSYCLASTYVEADDYMAYFGFRSVHGGVNRGGVSDLGCYWDSTGSFAKGEDSVRAVVSLKSDVQVVKA